MHEHRIRARIRRAGAAAPILAAVLLAGCLDGYAPDSGEVGRGQLSSSAVQGYLAQADLARPEIVQAVTMTLRRGGTYRQRVRDQSNRWTLATVYMDRRGTLHVVTTRDETCPDCNGTGKRQWNNKAMQRMPFDTRCLACKGKGYLEHHTVERKFTVSAMDYDDMQAARQAERRTAYADAPPETKEYVAMLADKDPAKRLEAILWLDRHYVKEGAFFQDLDPMLRKARQRDRNDRVMVWQFWAAKGMPGEHTRAYYRVYAHTKSGKVFRKGFYPEQ